MDFRRVRFAEMLALLGGVVLLASLFLPWYDYAGGRHSGFSSLTGALVPLLIAAVLAIYLFVITLISASPALPVAAAVWTSLWGIVAALVALVHVALPPSDTHATCYGAWVGFAGALAVLAGAWLAMRDDSPLRGVTATVPRA